MNIQDFTLNVDGDSIPWRIVSPGDASKEWCVFWLQGWSSSMDSHLDGVKRMATALDIPFVTMDYAGHGLHIQSLETTTMQQQQQEVVAIYDEIIKLGYKKIVTIGGSFGGYMTALLAGVRPIHSAVLRAPAAYLDKEFDTPHQQTAKYSNPKSHRVATEQGYLGGNRGFDGIKAHNGSVHVLEHELDSVIPKLIPQMYFEAAKHGNYYLIPGTDHSPKLMSDPEKHFQYIENTLITIVQSIQLQDQLELSY
jgi:dienelactone hydrolase